MKLKCKHILLSYDKAENSSHERPLGVAVADAEQLIKDIKLVKLVSQMPLESTVHVQVVQDTAES